MNRLTQAYRRVFLRRRRLWRYVSPRRRVVGLVLLATLLVAVYVYGRLTEDERVRRHARRYLSELTGGRVEIGHAHFSLLSGVTLRQVRLYPPGDRTAEPFLRAKTVLLRHKPWALLWHRTFQPEDVICLEPVITLEYDVQQDRYNFQRFFPAGGRSSLHGVPVTLPPIHVRQGRLRWVDVDHGLRMPFDEMPLSLSITPAPQGEYLVTFEEQREGHEPAIAGRLSLDLRTGQARLLEGTVPIPNLDKALPGKYRQWRQRYDVRGEVHLAGTLDPSAPTRAMECQLVDVSLTLPAGEGGLELSHVAGTVLFDETGVTLRDVVGEMPAVGGAEFALAGRYEGYEADSPFRLSASATSVTMPDPSQAAAPLTGLLGKLSRDYGLVGRCDLTAEFWREPGGSVDFRATVHPQGMSATCRYVPYRLDDLTGVVEVTPAAATLRGLEGERHGAHVTLDGVIIPADQPGATHLDITAKDVLLDRELRDALPAVVQKAWDVVGPSGRMSATVGLLWDGHGSIEHVDAVLEFNGQTSAKPRAFPYPVDNLIGRATVRDRDVTVEDVRGRRGGMDCLASGRILNAGLDSMDLDLTVEARRLPLDDVLREALPAEACQAMASLHASGWAEQVQCHLLQSPQAPLRYLVEAAVHDVLLRPEAVPCVITDGRGELQIIPGEVLLKQFTGACRDGRVVMSGRALLGGERLGLDLLVKATDLYVDDRLLAALPTGLGELGGGLSVDGPADVNLAVQAGQEAGPVAYHLTVFPHDMQVRYEGLGLAFSGVRGTVAADPGRLEMVNLTGVGGSAPARLEGVITTAGGTVGGDVQMTATGLPVTEGLVDAMPAEVSGLLGRLAGGGELDVNLRWTRPRQPVTTSSAPASSEPVASAQRTAWELEGGLGVRDLVLHVDSGDRRMSGQLQGHAVSAGGSLAVEADLSGGGLELGSHRLSDVQGQVVKPAGAAMLRIENLSARLHGGRVAGFAEVALTEPLRYGVSLSVEDLDLHDLFRSGEGATASQPSFEVRGLLRGNLQMTGTAGQPQTRQATGVLKITQARINRLPVVLGLVDIVYLWLPGQGGFAEGDVVYRLQGDKLILQEISLHGPASSLLGSGWVNLKDESLHLTFLTAPPGYLPRLAGVEDLLSGLSREIVEVRVTGTLSKPVPQTVSLPGLDAAVRRLLSPEGTDEE
jgi:hypothetical protein